MKIIIFSLLYHFIEFFAINCTYRYIIHTTHRKKRRRGKEVAIGHHLVKFSFIDALAKSTSSTKQTRAHNTRFDCRLKCVSYNQRLKSRKDRKWICWNSIYAKHTEWRRWRDNGEKWTTYKKKTSEKKKKKIQKPKKQHEIKSHLNGEK